jgi:hypothetical protein
MKRKATVELAYGAKFPKRKMRCFPGEQEEEGSRPDNAADEADQDDICEFKSGDSGIMSFANGKKQTSNKRYSQ